MIGTAEGEAKLIYAQASFDVVRPGAYVVCAVSGESVPLSQLRYWNVERQEPYRNAWAALEAARCGA